MARSIFGNWFSRSGDGAQHRYVFNENGTYTHAVRKEDGTWAAEEQGEFRYDAPYLTVQHADGPRTTCLHDDLLELEDGASGPLCFVRAADTEDDPINPLSNNPVEMDKPISQFTVYAPTGIGYAFWIRVDFKRPKDLTWHRSDRGPAVSVWFTKTMNLVNIVGIEEGMQVRLNIEVQAGSDNVRANQYFIYEKDAARAAYYEASGTSLDAAVTFIKYKDAK